jgi:MFS family permease
MQYQLNEFREYFIGNNQYKGVNSVLFGGIIGSLFSFLQFVSSSFMGALSDYYGRKPILIITMVSDSF